MAITATNSGGNYTPVPAGTYAARCYKMVHLGTAPETIKGVVKIMNKVMITWELPTELKVFKEGEGEGEKPLSISKEFTLSMNEKANLRKFLQSWRGAEFTKEQAEKFDITALLGVPCMLSVIHKTSGAGKVYDEITSVSKMPKGMTCPAQVNPNFELNYEKFDKAKFDSLPDFIKNKMIMTEEYKALGVQGIPPAAEVTVIEDETPF